MRLRFLGTGTSFGVPVVGCTCATCTSADPRDRRTRHAALLTHDAGTLLIDTPPELRLQLVAAGVRTIDAVWFTHAHADHVHGIDDLRVFSARSQRPLTAWADPQAAAVLRHRFSYIFDPEYSPPAGTSRPEIDLRIFDGSVPVEAAGFTLQPIQLPHGDVDTWGFRCGALGYVTDAKRLPPAARATLEGVRVLVLNALWYGDPHPTHFNVEEAIETARSIGAEQTWLTHLTHRLRHAQLEAELPPGIAPAYDGLTIEIEA